MSNYRIAHELLLLGVPLIPRIITEMAHSETGIDIHPAARIGHHFTIDHGTGVVIGATCIIGNHVKLYQGVTLGAKSFPLDDDGHPIKGIPRHPILEDDVIVYSNATILGLPVPDSYKRNINKPIANKHPSKIASKRAQTELARVCRA